MIRQGGDVVDYCDSRWPVGQEVLGPTAKGMIQSQCDFEGLWDNFFFGFIALIGINLD